MPTPAHLPYCRQSIDDDDIAAVTAVLRGDWLTQGPAVAQYEAALCERTGAAGCVAVSSGTAALHVAYAALGAGPGDEIITAPITFCATANAARMVGAEPVFADVEVDTGNLALDSVANRITDRTVGIAAVHYGGLPVDLAPLSKLAADRGLWLVEDACHALGAEYQGSVIGDCTYSDAAVLSTHAIKNITTGEGGAVLSAREDILARCRLLRTHGVDKHAGDPNKPWSYDMVALGWNYRITDLQCALGLSQLKRLDGWLRHREQLCSLYEWELARRFGDAVRAQEGRAGRRSGRHLMATQIDFQAFGVTRADLVRELAGHGVASQVHYIPVYQLSYYQQRYGTQHRAGAEHWYSQQLSLPLFVDMTDDDVRFVVSRLGQLLKH